MEQSSIETITSILEKHPDAVFKLSTRDYDTENHVCLTYTYPGSVPQGIDSGLGKTFRDPGVLNSSISSGQSISLYSKLQRDLKTARAPGFADLIFNRADGTKC